MVHVTVFDQSCIVSAGTMADTVESALVVSLSISALIMSHIFLGAINGISRPVMLPNFNCR